LTKINPVFERLIVELLIDMPENFVKIKYKYFLDRIFYRLVENKKFSVFTRRS